MADSYGAAAMYGVLTPELEPPCWRPVRIGVDSAWYGHIPFAHWVVGACRPRVLVELGTHAGVSYSAFCEAVMRERLPTRCLAIDTWKGDAHAGFYGEHVFEDWRAFHDGRYASFSQLVRCTFDEALPAVADGSVDLLHIDGRHTHDDVLHDFRSWQPKLSSRGVVLFHDTNVREGDFGVWRLWDTVRDGRPSFEFLHEHGLGVLAWGDEVPPAIGALCAASGTESATAIRERFALLGERWRIEVASRRLDHDLTALRAHAETLENSHAQLAGCGNLPSQIGSDTIHCLN